jgi:hypothetical protein
VTWLVNWNGKEYDADPTEFSGLELKKVKLRTGLKYKELINGISHLDPDALNAVFWVVDQRENPDLKFDDYSGPSIKVVLPYMEAWNEAMEEVGKALTPATESNGSQSSSSAAGAPEPTLTL